MKISLPATIEKLATRADNTIAITVSTQELPPEESAVLFSLKGKLGWCLFSEVELYEKDIPEEKPEFKNDKTKSQRYRAVIYKVWENNTSKSKPFNLFYDEWMESRIAEAKDLLN